MGCRGTYGLTGLSSYIVLHGDVGAPTHSHKKGVTKQLQSLIMQNKKSEETKTINSTDRFEKVASLYFKETAVYNICDLDNLSICHGFKS